MSRLSSLCAVLGLLSLIPGCLPFNSPCAACHDYCGPTYGDGVPCDFLWRRGSVVTGVPTPAVPAEYVEGQEAFQEQAVPMPTPAAEEEEQTAEYTDDSQELARPEPTSTSTLQPISTWTR